MFSHALAQLLEHDHPELVLSEMSKQARTGKVFVDWSQNDEHKTTIAVYSLRARERPTVSTPVTWEEVEKALKKKDASLLVFEAKQVVARFEKMGDLFEPVLELKQKLPDLRKTGAALAAEPERIEIAAQADEDDPAPRKKGAAKKQPVGRTRRGNDGRYNSDLCGAGTPARDAAPRTWLSKLYGAIFRRNFGMGLPNLEAGFLSGQAGAEEISGTLRHAAQYGRGELHFPATGERNHHPELAARHARAFSFRGQGASGHHAHQAAEGDRRFCAAISGDD